MPEYQVESPERDRTATLQKWVAHMAYQSRSEEAPKRGFLLRVSPSPLPHCVTIQDRTYTSPTDHSHCRGNVTMDQPLSFLLYAIHCLGKTCYGQRNYNDTLKSQNSSLKSRSADQSPHRTSSVTSDMCSRC